ncbi:hypothetical protein BN903_98 [Halorubrum sp. AJ67]|nr:hypothetical protein BN903_98 [Halorubrum sp. AJ67]
MDVHITLTLFEASYGMRETQNNLEIQFQPLERYVRAFLL